MVKNILQIGNPILTQTTKPVTSIESEETKKIVADLLDTCNATKDISAGLASPQIGYNKSICVCRRTDKEEKSPNKKIEWEVLINPVLKKTSFQESYFWEACLSIGEGINMLYGPVLRSSQVTVDYIDVFGKEKSITGSGFFSHLLQHELDHLKGILFLKYITDPSSLWKNIDFENYYKKTGEYPLIEE